MKSVLRSPYFIFGSLLIFTPRIHSQSAGDDLINQKTYFQETDYSNVHFQASKKPDNHHDYFQDHLDQSISTVSPFSFYQEMDIRNEPAMDRNYYASLVNNLNTMIGNPYLMLTNEMKSQDSIWDKKSTNNYTLSLKNDIDYLCDIAPNNLASSVCFIEITKCQIRENEYHDNLDDLLLVEGNDYFKGKNMEKTSKHLQEALDLANKQNNSSSQVTILEELCEVELWKRDYNSFKFYFHRLEKKLESITGEPGYYTGKIRLLEIEGDYHLRKEEYKKASELYKQAIKLQELYFENDETNDLSEIYMKIVGAYSKQSEPECALMTLQDGIDYFQNRKESDKALVTFYEAMSDVYVSMEEDSLYNLDSAYNYLDKAILLNEKINDQFIYFNCPLTSASYRKDLIEKAVSILHRKKNIDSSYIPYDKLKERFGLSKDFCLLKKLGFNKALNDLGYEERKRADSLIYEYGRIVGDPKIKKDSQQLLTYDLKKQLEEIVGPYVADDFDRISKDYIEFIYGKESIYVYATLGDQLLFTTIDKEATDSLIFKIIGLIKEQFNETELKQYLKKLRRLLIPYDLELPSKFTVIPDGPLSLLPFDILVDEDEYYLIENHTVNTQSSTIKIKHQSVNEPISIFCHSPYYGKTENSCSTLTRSNILPLPFAHLEINFIQNIFPNSTVAKSIAFDSLIGRIMRANIYHFVGHASASEGFVKMYVGNNLKDSILSLDQIYNHSFDLQMVTLSACETGIGKIHHGEGMNSLARAFTAAGARSILSSLWAVRDLSTSELMPKMYQNLVDGMSKDDALRKAKLDFREEADSEKKHPYHWAGFTIQGDMSPVRIRLNNHTALPIL